MAFSSENCVKLMKIKTIFAHHLSGSRFLNVSKFRIVIKKSLMRANCSHAAAEADPCVFFLLFKNGSRFSKIMRKNVL